MTDNAPDLPGLPDFAALTAPDGPVSVHLWDDETPDYVRELWHETIAPMMAIAVRPPLAAMFRLMGPDIMAKSIAAGGAAAAHATSDGTEPDGLPDFSRVRTRMADHGDALVIFVYEEA